MQQLQPTKARASSAKRRLLLEDKDDNGFFSYEKRVSSTSVRTVVATRRQVKEALLSGKSFSRSDRAVRQILVEMVVSGELTDPAVVMVLDHSNFCTGANGAMVYR
jgi:hypothetical protein